MKISRAERRERGLEKIARYKADVLIRAGELVEQNNLTQHEFHVEIMARRSLLEKATPQEKQLIAMAFDQISAQLSTMEATLKVGAPPKPEKKQGHNVGHKGVQGPHGSNRRKNPYPEPLSHR